MITEQFVNGDKLVVLNFSLNLIWITSFLNSTLYVVNDKEKKVDEKFLGLQEGGLEQV